MPFISTLENNMSGKPAIDRTIFTKGKDSTQINVGFYIDKKVRGGKDINFVTMPKGGPILYSYVQGKIRSKVKKLCCTAAIF